MIKKIFIGIVIAVVLTLSTCFCTMRCVAKGLGLAPEKEDFERFYEAPIEKMKIRYAYKPLGMPWTTICFEVSDPEKIKRVRNAFKITEVGPYMWGVDPDIAFYYLDDTKEPHIWKVNFSSRQEVLLAMDLSSCTALLSDGNAFYQLVLDLAWENNKLFFPNSARKDIDICN